MHSPSLLSLFNTVTNFTESMADSSETTQRLLSQMMVKMEQMSAQMEIQQGIIAEMKAHKKEEPATASGSGEPGQTRQGDIGLNVREFQHKHPL